MSESTKTAEKCAKCGVTNPISFTKCRRCGKTLQWATAAAPVSVDPLSAPPSNAPPSSAAPLSAPPSALSSTRSSRSAAKAGKDAAAIPANATLPGELTTGANRPPQVYTGGPPTRVRDLPDAPERNMTPFYAGGVVGALVLLFLIFRLISPKPVDAITDMQMHITTGKTFQVLAPKDAAWELHEGARADGLQGGSRWENGSAKVDVEADAAGSFMSDTMKLTAKSPTQALHEMAVKKMAEKYGNYEEDPSKMYVGAFGETWSCEFTGQGGVREGKIHGLRATTRSGENRIQFLATCREDDWDKLKPGFEKILASVAPPSDPPAGDPSAAIGAAPAGTS